MLKIYTQRDACLVFPLLLSTPCDADVFKVDVPAHTEWCTKASFDPDKLSSLSGRLAAFDTGVTPLRGAAIKASLDSIGYPYEREFAVESGKVTILFCAVAKSDPEMDGGTVWQQDIPVTTYLAATCKTEAAETCRTEVVGVIKNAPYNVGAELIEKLAWRSIKYSSGDPAEVTAKALATDTDYIVRDAPTALPGEVVRYSNTVIAVPEPVIPH